MSKKCISTIVINILAAIIALGIGIVIYNYNFAYNVFCKNSLLDNPIKYNAMVDWIKSKQVCMEYGYRIVYFSFSIYAIVVTYIESKNIGAIKKGVILYIRFQIIAITLRNLVFGVNLFSDIIIILFLGLILWLYYEYNECKDDEPKKTASYEELFESREKTINDIIDAIDNPNSSHNNNHNIKFNGLLLKGSWGVGKSYFIEVLKKELKSRKALNNKYDIIELNVGYSCDPTKLLSEIESQMCDILSDEYYFFGINGIIKDYFKQMCNIITNPSKDFFKLFIEFTDINEDALIVAKKDIDCFLGKSKTKKIIIIDDLERCPSENIKNIFSVLMNTLNLKNCITILITDYDYLLNSSGLSDEFINKYFMESFSIYDITYKEMAEKYIIGEKVQPTAIADSNINVVKEYFTIFEHYWKLLDKFIYDYIKDNKTEDEQLRFVKRLKKNIHNPRQFERMWDEVVDYVAKVSALYMEDKELFLGNLVGRDASGTICQIVVMKHFFPNIWDDYLLAGKWGDFKNNQSNQYKEINRAEYNVFSQTIIKDIHVDSLIDFLVFGHSNIKDLDLYKEYEQRIKNNTINGDEIEELIGLASDNKELIILVGDYILDNFDSISDEDKLAFCKAFTSLMKAGINDSMAEKDGSFQRMIWNMNKEIKGIHYTQYDKIKKEKISEAYNECEDNVIKAINTLLLLNLKTLDSTNDWGYSEYVGDFEPKSKFVVVTSPFSMKEKKHFEQLMNNLLVSKENLLIRDLDDFIRLFLKYIESYLPQNRDRVLANENSFNDYNASIKHIGRMHRVVCDWLGDYTRVINIKKLLLQEQE